MDMDNRTTVMTCSVVERYSGLFWDRVGAEFHSAPEAIARRKP